MDTRIYEYDAPEKPQRIEHCLLCVASFAHDLFVRTLFLLDRIGCRGLVLLEVVFSPAKSFFLRHFHFWFESIEIAGHRLTQRLIRPTKPWASFRAVEEELCVPEKEPTEERVVADVPERIAAHAFGMASFFCMSTWNYLVPDQFVGRTIWRVSAAMDFLVHCVGGASARFLESVIPRPIVWVSILISHSVVSAVLHTIDFLYLWWFSRNWRKLLFVLPTAIIGSVLMVLFAVAPSILEGRPDHYLVSLAEAEANQEFARAELLRKKLHQIGFRHGDHLDFRGAALLAKDGNIDEAFTVMQELAPLNEAKHCAAHLWMATAIFKEQVPYEGDKWSLIESHARLALTLEPKNTSASYFLGQALTATGRFREAIPMLERAAAKDEGLHGSLAVICVRAGQVQEARKHAGAARRHFLEQFELDQPSDLWQKQIAIDQDQCILFSDVLAILGDVSGQQRLLQWGHESTGSDRISRLWRETLLAHATSAAYDDKVKASAFESLLCKSECQKQAAEILEQQLRKDPSELDVFSHLHAKRILPARIELMLGDIAFLRGMKEQAISHYAQVVRRDPQSAVAYNNLAWLWATTSGYDIAKALRAANRAIEISPDPRFFATRGEIYYRAKDWIAAARDLRVAVKQSAGPRDELKELLSECIGRVAVREDWNQR